MSTEKKSLLQKIKAFFDAPPAAAAPASSTGVATPFKLQDGSEITITIEDPAVSMAPDMGDAVTIAGAPAPAADYVLEDGTTITVDATGNISAVTPATPITQTPEEMAAAAAAKAAQAQPVMLTAESVAAMYAKFATGTPEERLANLEVMCKALMESNFGYQIRQGQENAAIQVYKDSLANATAAVAPQLATALQKIEKQDEVIKMQFELLEKLVEEPTTTPQTLTGSKKDRFEKLEKREDKFKKMADDLKAAKQKSANPAA